jgi:hypothetical protein
MKGLDSTPDWTDFEISGGGGTFAAKARATASGSPFLTILVNNIAKSF